MLMFLHVAIFLISSAIICYINAIKRGVMIDSWSLFAIRRMGIWVWSMFKWCHQHVTSFICQISNVSFVQEVATPRISLFTPVVELNNLLSLGSVPSQLRASVWRFSMSFLTQWVCRGWRRWMNKWSVISNRWKKAKRFLGARLGPQGKYKSPA